MTVIAPDKNEEPREEGVWCAITHDTFEVVDKDINLPDLTERHVGEKLIYCLDMFRPNPKGSVN